MFNPMAESVNCSLFFKILEKHFCDLTYKKKNFLKHIESLPQHLSEKFIGDNLPIIKRFRPPRTSKTAWNFARQQIG